VSRICWRIAVQRSPAQSSAVQRGDSQRGDRRGDSAACMHPCRSEVETLGEDIWNRGIPGRGVEAIASTGSRPVEVAGRALHGCGGMTAAGLAGLANHSRRFDCQPCQLDAEIEAVI
jgi:hypothetical protein